MAITRDDVLTAVEQFLPRTANFARSEDLGEYDRESVFSRIVQIMLTSLLVDKDALFFLVYLSAQRLLQDIDTALAALDALDSEDQLRGISPNPPTRISDLTGLTDAQNALLGMSGSLVTDVFGINQYGNFESSIDDFLASEVVPNVKGGGNNEKTSVAIRASLATLADTWALILSRREKLFQIVDSYESVDLRVRVAATVISAIRQKISELQTQLPALSTSAQAQQAEQILLDLSAAKASLKIIAQAESPFGSLVVGPSAAGFTEAEYLVVEGRAKVDPIRPILRGDDGRLFFDNVLVSSTGQTVFDGDDYTPTLSDPSIPDFTTAVAAGQYLTLVDRGERYQLSAVAAAALTLNGQTLHSAATPLRYVVTETSPGTFFRSQSSDFWDEYAGASTKSSVVTSGTSGAWVRQDKISGTDGTNIKVSGVSGTFRPTKTSGVSGVQTITSSDFSDASATLLSDGVAAGDRLFVSGLNSFGNPYTVSSISSETDLQITGSWGANSTTSWYIEDPDAGYWFYADEDLLAAGVQVTDTLSVTSGAQQGDYVINAILTSTLLELTTTQFNETAFAWEIRHSATTFVSESSNFYVAEVVAGDILDISGVGLFLIVSVDSATQLTLSTPAGIFYSGATFSVYASSTLTTKFTQTDGANFVTLGVDAYIGGQPAILRVSSTDYQVVSRNLGSPTDSLTVATSATVNLGPLSWAVRAGDTTDTFYDYVNSPFLSYQAGDILVYKPGTVNEVRVSITDVVGANEVRVSGALPEGQTSVSYAVISTYKTGLQLLVAGRRHDIVDIVDIHTLEVSPPLALTVGRDVEFFIVNRGATPVSYRLVDPTGASLFGPSGFPSSVVGTDIDIMMGSQMKGRVTAIADINGDSVFEAFDVNTRMKIGQRGVLYRLRALISDTTNVFKTADLGASGVASEDTLTVWLQDSPYEIVSSSYNAPNYLLTVDGLLPSRLASQDFIVVRGGSSYHGRYLLLDSKNAALTISPNTNNLRVAAAEVLLDFGSNTIPITSGSAGDLSFDEDGDGYTDTLSDLSATFVTSGVLYGHRVDVTYPDASVKKSYVTEVISETSIRISPSLKIPVPATSLSWSIVRSSVSNALDDSNTLRTELQALRDVIDRYVVPQNTTVLNMMTLLKKHRMDRAIDLLYNGDILSFVNMTSVDSSYSSRARSSVQTVGGTTSSSASLSGSGNSGATTVLAGIDPATGQSGKSSIRASATQLYSVGGSEVETRVALAKAVTDLVADERIRSMLQFNIDEARNQGIYELIGEIESGVVSDEDPTLPWLAKTGSTKTKIEGRVQAAIDAIQYMIDNPTLFDDVTTGSLG